MKRIGCLLFAAAFIGTSGLHATDIWVTCPANQISGPFTILDGIQGGTYLPNILAGVSNGTAALWGWDGTNYHSSHKVAGSWDNNPQLAVGEAFWVRGTRTNYLHWVVEGGSPSAPLTLASDLYYLRGSPLYTNATYEDVVGASPQDGTTLLRNVAYGIGTADPYPTNTLYWQAYNYTNGVWTPSAPVLQPLEAAFIIYSPLRVSIAPTDPPPQLVLTWPRGRLQSTDSISNSWIDVTNAVSPYVVDPSITPDGTMLFRAAE